MRRSQVSPSNSGFLWLRIVHSFLQRYARRSLVNPWIVHSFLQAYVVKAKQPIPCVRKRGLKNRLFHTPQTQPLYLSQRRLPHEAATLPTLPDLRNPIRYPKPQRAIMPPLPSRKEAPHLNRRIADILAESASIFIALAAWELFVRLLGGRIK